MVEMGPTPTQPPPPPQSPMVKIERTQPSVTEGSTFSFKLTANLAPPSRIDINVRINQNGNFLTGTIPTDIALAQGNTVAWLILQTEDDDVSEGDGSVTAEIRPGSGYYVGIPSSDTATVTDPQPPPPIRPTMTTCRLPRLGCGPMVGLRPLGLPSVTESHCGGMQSPGQPATTCATPKKYVSR